MLLQDLLKLKDITNYMGVNMTNKDLMKKIAEISLVLGQSKRFSMHLEITVKDFFDGVQVNWHGNGLSLMWRSVHWDKERLELYTGSDLCSMLEINEII